VEQRRCNGLLEKILAGFSIPKGVELLDPEEKVWTDRGRAEKKKMGHKEV